MRATLLALGNWSYVYMANETIELLGESVSISKCEALSYEFDLTIYPNAIEVAGNPDGNLGDIDGDPHITIFLAPLVRHYGDNSVLGYYDDKDDDPNNPYSNFREMVYIDSERPLQDTYRIIAHELNHLIWGNYEFDEAEFLTEGLANYAVDFCGYYWWVIREVATTFTYHPEISLLYFVREYGELWDASYGQAYLFLTYLANRFGNDFAKELVSIAADGAKSLDVALGRFGHNLTSNDVYLDWITACTLDDTTFADGIYGFETVDYMIRTQTYISSFPIEKHDIKHYYYGFDVKRIYADCDNFTFVIENPYPNALGISIAFLDDTGWNVTQVLNSENSERIYLYVEGDNIQEAYVITSLMSPDTPTDFGIVYNLSEISSESLDYSFYEGTPKPSDVAVVEVVSTKTVVCQGYNLNINATIENQGYTTETFDVTVYANTTIISELTDITITSGRIAVLTFTWETTSFPRDTYIIYARATPVPGETDTADNTYTFGTVLVTIKGDVVPEFRIVDIYDLISVATSFGTSIGEPNFKPNADINSDNTIDIFDLIIVATHYGEVAP